MINGEIGIHIKEIKLMRFTDNTYEMMLVDHDGSFLYICGQNDLKTLLEDALNNIEETGI